MSNRKVTKRDAHQAELVNGSLYLQENIDFITKTKELAQVIHEKLNNDQDDEKNQLRREIATLHQNLRDLELTMQVRLIHQINIEKRQLAAEEDSWMFGDEYAKRQAIEHIAYEDGKSAWKDWNSEPVFYGNEELRSAAV